MVLHRGIHNCRVLSLNLGVFERWGPEVCTFGVLGVSCEALAHTTHTTPHHTTPHHTTPHHTTPHTTHNTQHTTHNTQHNTQHTTTHTTHHNTHNTTEIGQTWIGRKWIGQCQHEVERDFRHSGLDPLFEVVPCVPNVTWPLSVSLSKKKNALANSPFFLPPSHFSFHFQFPL